MYKRYGTDGHGLLPVILVLCLVGVLGMAAVGILQNSKSRDQFLATTSGSAEVNPTASSSADQTTTKTNVNAIATQLEGYFAVNSYYPSSISPQEFDPSSSGMQSSGSDPVALIQKLTTTPSGTAYSYSAAPVGCSTAAHDCQHYDLTAEDASGRLIIEKKDLNF